jgi:hypothetical protein
MAIDKVVELLAPLGADLLAVQHTRALPPFSPQVLSFLGDLSDLLRADPRVRLLPDLYSFGFWCRRTSIEAMGRNYADKHSRLGRGIVFHIGPANVPVNFAYSLVAGLLAGNANLVRVPTADFLQVAIIAQTLDTLLKKPEHHELRDHIRLVRYDRNSQEATARFSKICDVRVIWGGDDTIEVIRSNKLNARAFDITFADRYSACIIDAENYLQRADHASLAQAFYNDTYLFDQNACTAPHLVLWMGEVEVVNNAKQLFWENLQALVEKKYTIDAQSAVTKLTSALRYAALHDRARIFQSRGNLITRISISDLERGIEDWHANCGFFFECHLTSIDQILPVITRKYQTLSYAGLSGEVLRQLLIQARSLGIDRIVPIGRTLEFSLEWDGHDLIRSMSRIINRI